MKNNLEKNMYFKCQQCNKNSISLFPWLAAGNKIGTLTPKFSKNQVLILYHPRSSKEFVEAVDSEIGVISVDRENSYEHPVSEVLEIFKKYGINILRTYELGDIKIISDGQTIKVINH